MCQGVVGVLDLGEKCRSLQVERWRENLWYVDRMNDQLHLLKENEKGYMCRVMCCGFVGVDCSRNVGLDGGVFLRNGLKL